MAIRFNWEVNVATMGMILGAVITGTVSFTEMKSEIRELKAQQEVLEKSIDFKIKSIDTRILAIETTRPANLDRLTRLEVDVQALKPEIYRRLERMESKIDKILETPRTP